jgi:hypothetical protein
MNVIPFTESVSHLMSSLTIDDNGVAVLAVLLGVIGGWYFGNFREQLKAKRAEAQRKNSAADRKRR